MSVCQPLTICMVDNDPVSAIIYPGGMHMRKNKTAYITRCALLAAIICLISPIAIPVGAVPVTLSVFAVLLASLMLDWKAAAAAVGIYVLIGCCGLPVFSGGQGGVAMLFGPTGGYIWSYIPMSALVSKFGKGKPPWKACMASLGGLIVCYVCGTVQYALVSGSGFAAALGVCVLPFAGFDVVKIVCAVFLSHRIEKRLQDAGHSA